MPERRPPRPPHTRRTWLALFYSLSKASPYLIANNDLFGTVEPRDASRVTMLGLFRAIHQVMRSTMITGSAIFSVHSGGCESNEVRSQPRTAACKPRIWKPTLRRPCSVSSIVPNGRTHSIYYLRGDSSTYVSEQMHDCNMLAQHFFVFSTWSAQRPCADSAPTLRRPCAEHESAAPNCCSCAFSLKLVEGSPLR